MSCIFYFSKKIFKEGGWVKIISFGMKREKEINMMSDVRMIWSHGIVMWKIIMTLLRAVLLSVILPHQILTIIDCQEEILHSPWQYGANINWLLGSSYSTMTWLTQSDDSKDKDGWRNNNNFIIDFDYRL